MESRHHFIPCTEYNTTMAPGFEQFGDMSSNSRSRPRIPPIRGYRKEPPKLTHLSNLIGQVITHIHRCDGTYGMGGPGWVSFIMSGWESFARPSESWESSTRLSTSWKLLYTIWSGDDWIFIDNLSLRDRMSSDPVQYEEGVHWRITNAIIDGMGNLELYVIDEINSVPHIIRICNTIQKEDVRHVLEENLSVMDGLRVCRHDSHLWVGQ